MTISLLTFFSMAGGVLVGVLVRRMLPAHHLSDDSKDVVKTVAGMLATLIALIIGLLVTAAKETFDAANAGITGAGAKIIMVDRLLARYGADADGARQQLRESVAAGIERIWPSKSAQRADLHTIENATSMEDFYDTLRKLTPQDDSQRYLHGQALQLAGEMMQTRWMLIEQSQNHLPTMLLGVLIAWLAILFLSFGLLTPQNTTAISSLVIGGVSIAVAIFLILELNRPLEGTIKVSSAPLQKALVLIGK